MKGVWLQVFVIVFLLQGFALLDGAYQKQDNREVVDKKLVILGIIVSDQLHHAAFKKEFGHVFHNW